MAEVQAVMEHGYTDLTTRADVEALLRRFYGRVLLDDVLADPFTELRIKGLDSHLPVMCDFWETVLFHAGRYRGSALDAHRHVHHRTPLSGRHFRRWLSTWTDTVDEMYRGPVAERAKVQAARIAWAMHRRLTGTDSPEFDTLVASRTRIPARASTG
jgi:hemoglobin